MNHPSAPPAAYPPHPPTSAAMSGLYPSAPPPTQPGVHHAAAPPAHANPFPAPPPSHHTSAPSVSAHSISSISSVPTVSNPNLPHPAPDAQPAAHAPAPHAPQPIHVPGQGTMYPITGPNGQVTYSFQPQQFTHAPAATSMPMQGSVNGSPQYPNQMGMSQPMNSMAPQTAMQGPGMHGGMHAMQAQPSMPMQHQHAMSGQPGMHGATNGMGTYSGMGMQASMNPMGAEGMGGMGAHGGINGMGMQGGMNPVGMHGGINPMGAQAGLQPGMSNMGMPNGINQMGMQGGMNGMAMGGHGGAGNPGGVLQLRSCGGFKDMNSQVHDLPQVTITNIDEAGNRLFALKTKVNELQAKHDSYKSRQVANGGVAAASALFTFGTSLLVQGPAAVHMHNRMQTIKRAIPACLEQINTLRECYGQDPSWPQREATIMITEKVFANGVNRNDLKGGL